jgi:YD repeat-containing protein
MGQTTTLNYSPRGELISIIDPFGEKIELVYQRGMLKEAKSYDGTSVNYVYNADKQLSTVTYEDGTSTTYSYNAKGDLENIKDSNGLVTKTLTYDSTVYVNKPLREGELENIRNSVNRQAPLGQEQWQMETATKYGMLSTLRSRGRPSL